MNAAALLRNVEAANNPAAPPCDSGLGLTRSRVYRIVAAIVSLRTGIDIPPQVGYVQPVERKSSLPEDVKRGILNRLKTARGHLDGVIKLVEDDTYCVQVIKQIAAVRGALDRVSRIELENHLRHCLVEQVHCGKSIAAVAEVVEILGLRQEIA